MESDELPVPSVETRCFSEVASISSGFSCSHEENVLTSSKPESNIDS
jgi:hypothetical protein